VSVEAVSRNAKWEAKKRFEMIKRLDVTFRQKSCQLMDITLTKYFTFVVESCDYHAEPDTVLLFRRSLWSIQRRNPPCNAEDNLRAEHVVIEDWFRGY
jgi:hypothetical protein